MPAGRQGFAPILILIFLVLLVGGVYYFGTKNKIIPSPVASSHPSSSPIVISTPDSATKNWKIYSNKEYGFSVRYPEYYKITIDKFKPAHMSDFEVILQNPSGNSNVNGSFSNPFLSFRGIKNTTTQQIINDIVKEYKSPPEELYYGWEPETTVDDISIGSVNGKTFFVAGNEGAPAQYIFLDDNSKKQVVEIEIQYSSSEKVGKSEVNQILSTFKFTQ